MVLEMPAPPSTMVEHRRPAYTQDEFLEMAEWVSPAGEGSFIGLLLTRAGAGVVLTVWTVGTAGANDAPSSGQP